MSTIYKESDVCIVSAARTPLGSFGGSLAHLSAPELGGAAIKGALERAGISPASVHEVFFGNVCPANLGQAPATRAAHLGGIPFSVPCTGINKVCSSGLKAVMLGAQSIIAGGNEIVVAGGMESMSNIPLYLPRPPRGTPAGTPAAEPIDGMVKDGLWDPYSDIHMGNCAELCAAKYHITRAEQDEHAARSHARARAAAAAGWSGREIVAILNPKTGMLVSEDDGPRKGSDKITGLKAVFQKDGFGTVTAGNASPLTDGAAALVLASGAAVRRLGLPVLAVLRGWADANQAPEWFTTSPSLVVPKVLERASLTQSQVDYWEVNEAFSVVDIANQRLLNLPVDRVNAHGGAVSLGHPIGASGARILVTLINVLHTHGGRYGVAAICNGGGGASAVAVEAVPQARL